LALVEFLGNGQVFDRQLAHVNLLKWFALPGTAPGTVSFDCRKRASGGIVLVTINEDLGTLPVGFFGRLVSIALAIAQHIGTHR
jgi:hypothetical protein